ncbi:hypothetical protein Tco_0407216 [Tanacetum coccineum]
MALIFRSKSRFSMIMSLFILRAKLTTLPVVSIRDKNVEESWAVIEDLALYEDEGIVSNAVVDKNIIEPIELVDKEEAMDDEMDTESIRSVKDDSTRWGKYADGLLEIPRSVGLYVSSPNESKSRVFPPNAI